MSTPMLVSVAPAALIAAAPALAAGAQQDAAQSSEKQRPNIVYIVSDDQGWKDVGYHGSDIKTPNIDALAGGGTRLEQYYAQPMCTPTRSALMTGRYPFRYGLQTAVILSSHTYGLATDEWLLPQALKDAGYETAIVGKWHLGHGDQKYWPRQRGFDHQYGPLIGEIDYYTHEQHGVLDWFRDNKPVREKGYTTSLLGDAAVDLIDSHNTKTPLFLYLAFNAPHTPFQAPEAYVDRYRDIADPTRRTYAAQITAMDDQIGRVVDALDKIKMRDNTLIVFQSDNGGTNNPLFAGEGDMSKIKLPNDNGPFREGKASIYEGGTRVISLANWPGISSRDWWSTRRSIRSTCTRPLSSLRARVRPRRSRSTDSTSGERSAKASPRPAPKSSTTSSLSAPACVKATGSSSGERRCRRRSNSTTSPAIPPKRTMSRTPIQTRSRRFRSAPTSSPRPW
jgi:sulfatase-like protein